MIPGRARHGEEARRRGPTCAVFAIVGLLCVTGTACAGARARRIQNGAVELLVGGQLTRIEGTSTSRLQLGAARYAWRGRLRLGADLAHEHVSDLDVLDLEFRPGWVIPVGTGGMYVVPGGALGIRQEWVGSFQSARYPVGFGVALKAMAGTRASLTVRSAWRRVLGDPAADFNELRVLVSLSIWLHNQE